jgi:hypothetical protein
MMERLKTLFGRYYNPMVVKLAGMLLVLAIVVVAPGAPHPTPWPGVDENASVSSTSKPCCEA